MLDEREFSLAFSRALGKVVVHVHGALDANTAHELTHRLVDIIDGQGNLQLVVDLSRTTHVDSVGLSVLAGAQERLRRNGGALVLSGPTRNVALAVRAAGLDKVLVITPTWEHPAHGHGLTDQAGPPAGGTAADVGDYSTW